MEVILINLDNASDRLAFQQEQLARLGITFTRKSASCLSHQRLYQHYSDKWQRPLSYAEVSCFLNHKAIWQSVAAGTEPVLILEDDAYLAEEAGQVLREIAALQNIDYLNIEARGNNQKKLLEKKPRLFTKTGQIFTLFQGRSGTGGYVLWPAGAKKLLKQSRKVQAGLADKFINANYSLLAYQLEPAILIQLDKCEHYGISPPIATTSSIAAGLKESPLSHKYWVYKGRRLMAQLRIAINFVVHFYHGDKRPIMISDTFKKH
jgi:glycosyl transferase family 25